MTKGKVPKNPLVGPWNSEDMRLIREWALKQLDNLKSSDHFKRWCEVFPDFTSLDKKLADLIEEIGPWTGLHKSIIDLVKAMGTEPDVGMLIVQMNLQTPLSNGKCMDVPSFIFLLNSMLRMAPRFIEDGSRKELLFVVAKSVTLLRFVFIIL